MGAGAEDLQTASDDVKSQGRGQEADSKMILPAEHRCKQRRVVREVVEAWGHTP